MCFKLDQIQAELSDLFEQRTIDSVTLKSLNHRIRDRVLAAAEISVMSQRDDRVYIGHRIDTANKAIGFVEGLSREDFDDNEL